MSKKQNPLWIGASFAKLLCQFLASLTVLLAGSFGQARSENGLEAARTILEPSPQFKQHFFEESYVRPNERHPNHAQPIWQQTSAGAYIAVGTERGFVGFASSQATRLILVDSSPYVVAYNETNRIFLALSEDLKDYLHLKRRASFEEILSRAQSSEFCSQAEIDWLSSEFVQSLWLDGVRKKSRFLGTDLFGKLGLNGFSEVNYQIHDELYQRLRIAARSRKIHVFKGNFNFARTSSDLREFLVTSEEKISVLDLSNAWESHFINPEALKTLITHATRVSGESSQVLITNVEPMKWTYYAFPMASFDPEHVFFQHRYRLESALSKASGNTVIQKLPALCSKVLTK